MELLSSLIIVFDFSFSFCLNKKKLKFKNERQLQFSIAQNAYAMPPIKLQFTPFVHAYRTITNVCTYSLNSSFITNTIN